MAENQQAPLIDPAVVANPTIPKPISPEDSLQQTPHGKAESKPKKPADKGGFFWGTGRRKSSVARVRIKPGDGKLLINKREIDAYFTQQQDRNATLSPLKATDMKNSFDIFVNVKGGGTTGQAGAVMLGIARALGNYDDNLLKPLRDGGYLTRDGRMVERKKPGQRGARKKFQFSKR